GTAYFNFLASHDGIGLRPAEGLLSSDEINELVTTMQDFDGKISWRTSDNGTQSPYEINIALIDACKGTHEGEDDWQVSRFICAHTIMLGLEGIPGIYIHSLLGTTNDLERVTNTGQNRSINRHRWMYDSLAAELTNENTLHHVILKKMKELISIRQSQRAFHPNATQFTLRLGPSCFGYWRQSMDRSQSIFCLSNITKTEQTLRVSDVNLISTQDWYDLLSGEILPAEQQIIKLAPYQTLWLTNHYAH
ncbi:MAG: alpha-amylase, partial [Glaciecola sp.]